VEKNEPKSNFRILFVFYGNISPMILYHTTAEKAIQFHEKILEDYLKYKRELTPLERIVRSLESLESAQGLGLLSEAADGRSKKRTRSDAENE
jgi:hypothetical protein